MRDWSRTRSLRTYPSTLQRACALRAHSRDVHICAQRDRRRTLGCSVRKKGGVKWKIAKSTREINFSDVAPKHRGNAIVPPYIPRIVTSGSSIDTRRAGRGSGWPGDPWAMTPRAFAPILIHGLLVRVAYRRQAHANESPLRWSHIESWPAAARYWNHWISWGTLASRVGLLRSCSVVSGHARAVRPILDPSFILRLSLARFAPKLPHSARISCLELWRPLWFTGAANESP